LLDESKLDDIHYASLGENPQEEYYFDVTEKDGDSKTRMAYYGPGLAAPLLSYLLDEDKKWKRDNELQVVLGPNKSFFAWDSSSMRWSNLPPDLEETIQEWLSPNGWIVGPPRIIALGKGGAFFAKSQYGSMVWSLPESSPQMRIQVAYHKEVGEMGMIEVNYRCQDKCRKDGLL